MRGESTRCFTVLFFTRTCGLPQIYLAFRPADCLEQSKLHLVMTSLYLAPVLFLFFAHPVFLLYL